MHKSIAPQGVEMFPGLKLLEDEYVLLTGCAKDTLRNPLQPNRKRPDGFVLTNRRLVMLSEPKSSGTRIANLTSMPLTEISCVQVSDVGWSFLNVLGLIVLTLLYIVPGVIFLFYMLGRTGLWLVAHAGACSHEVRFGRKSAPLLSELIDLIQTHRTAQSL
jgi:hypothetical protein